MSSAGKDIKQLRRRLKLVRISALRGIGRIATLRRVIHEWATKCTSMKKIESFTFILSIRVFFYAYIFYVKIFFFLNFYFFILKSLLKKKKKKKVQLAMRKDISRCFH